MVYKLTVSPPQQEYGIPFWFLLTNSLIFQTLIYWLEWHDRKISNDIRY